MIPHEKMKVKYENMKNMNMQYTVCTIYSVSLLMAKNTDVRVALIVRILKRILLLRFHIVKRTAHVFSNFLFS